MSEKDKKKPKVEHTASGIPWVADRTQIHEVKLAEKPKDKKKSEEK